MNDSANSQYYQTISEINTIQNQSIDPSDMGAYNLTMYGMNSIHEIQSSVVGPMSQLQHLYGQVVNQYNIPYDPTSLPSSPGVTAGGSLFSSIISNPSSLMPTHNIITAAGLVLLVLVIGRSVFLKR
jgi:hypothetical protein